jgi:hypothetical protein
LTDRHGLLKIRGILIWLTSQFRGIGKEKFERIAHNYKEPIDEKLAGDLWWVPKCMIFRTLFRLKPALLAIQRGDPPSHSGLLGLYTLVGVGFEILSENLSYLGALDLREMILSTKVKR